jgi:hypothetical protein
MLYADFRVTTASPRDMKRNMEKGSRPPLNKCSLMILSNCSGLSLGQGKLRDLTFVGIAFICMMCIWFGGSWFVSGAAFNSGGRRPIDGRKAAFRPVLGECGGCTAGGRDDARGLRNTSSI